VSLPAWGEWIEILMIRTTFSDLTTSLPAWGEWIEITKTALEMDIARSLPAWGEWIEI